MYTILMLNQKGGVGKTTMRTSFPLRLSVAARPWRSSLPTRRAVPSMSLQ